MPRKNLTIEVLMGNELVQTPQQVADIVLSAQSRIRAGEESGSLLDRNGNYAGYFEYGWKEQHD